MPDEGRRALVVEHNALIRELKTLREKERKMDEHEGEDGTEYDGDAHCALVDEIEGKTRRLRGLRAKLYPTK